LERKPRLGREAARAGRLGNIFCGHLTAGCSGLHSLLAHRLMLAAYWGCLSIKSPEKRLETERYSRRLRAKSCPLHTAMRVRRLQPLDSPGLEGKTARLPPGWCRLPLDVIGHRQRYRRRSAGIRLPRGKLFDSRSSRFAALARAFAGPLGSSWRLIKQYGVF
jgi:hypothetical protein